MRLPDPRGRGLSLIETIFSLFLLGAMVVLLANLFPTSILALRGSEARGRASLVAESILAQASTAPYSSLVVGVRTLEPIEEGGATLMPTLEVFEVSNRDPRLLMGLKATVSWTTSRKQHRLERVVWIANARR